MPFIPAGRALALAGLLALALTACGRRGPLEPPPDPSAVRPPGQEQKGKPRSARGSAAAAPSAGSQAPTGAQAMLDEDDDLTVGTGFLPGLNALTGQPSQTNDPRRRRGYTVPREPFILDPLL